MRTLSVRVSDEVYSKYMSKDPEERRRLYRAIQAVVASIVEGKLDPTTPVKIEVSLCEERGARIGEAQRAYIYAVEALAELRRWEGSGASRILQRLRKLLILLSLHLPDKEGVRHLRRIQKAYQRIVEAYVGGRQVGEEHIKELVDALLEMKSYLESRYPVF